MIITIDGASGVGKSAVANNVARKLGVKHISVGLLFRAIAWCVWRKEEDFFSELQLTYSGDHCYPSILYKNKDITSELQGNIEIEKTVSTIGADTRYQELVFKLIRDVSANGAVIEGRNTSDFFKDAILHVFLDACKEERVSRNLEEYKRVTSNPNTDVFIESNIVRNESDIKRSVGTLRMKENMFYIDSTHLTLEESVYRIARMATTMKQKNSMLASVIIPVYNREDHLKLCLENLSVQDISANQYEIIVVDDHSSDQSASVASTFPNVTLVTLTGDDDRGPSHARNRGLNVSTGEIVIFIDSDILVGRDFISNHLKYHNKSSNTVVLGARRHLKDSETKIREDSKPDSREVLLKSYSQDINFLSAPWSICYTCNVSLDANLAKYNMFNNDFKGWGIEDIEWGFRLHKSNVNWLFSTSTVGYHIYHDRSMNDERFKKWKQNYRFFLSLHPEKDVQNFSIFSSVFDPDLQANYMEIYDLFNKRKNLRRTVSVITYNSLDIELMLSIQEQFIQLRDESDEIIIIVPESYLDMILPYSTYLHRLSPFRVFTIKQWNKNRELILNEYEQVLEVLEIGDGYDDSTERSTYTLR